MKSDQEPYGRLVHAKALFGNGDFQRAIAEVQKLKERQFESQTEQQDMKRQLEVLTRKIEIEMTNSNRVGNINDAAYLSSSRPVKASAPVEERKQVPVAQPGPPIDKKFDWYQNPTYVFISYKVSSPDVGKEAEISFEEETVTLTYKDQTIKIELTNKIVPDGSSKSVSAKKIELKLKKAIENVNWMGVEKGGEAKLLATATPIPQGNAALPSYPTSSKNKKNWDSIDKQITKEESQEKEPQGDSALNSLFKSIYERSDENTRRAMIKSFQTSGGTVLSTNWDEVASKDYEGKDRPDAPDGQEWAKDK